jgi:hypothetical protein
VFDGCLCRQCCLYKLFIQFVYTGDWLGKVFYGFRFDPVLYGEFKRVTGVGGCTVTGAFERFMSNCVAADSLVFAEEGSGGFDAEARVLVDWLCKGKSFYRSVEGNEMNVQGRLLWLLPKVHDSVLRKEVEDTLKQSVPKKE